METFLQDLRYALRQLRKAPGFTITAILTLALGIGANTTIFSAINTALFRPLRYPENSRLVAVFNQNVKDRRMRGLSTGDLANWKRQNSVFDQLEASSTFAAKIVMAGPGGPMRIGVQYVTPGLLPLLGVKPVLGRLLLDADAKPNNEFNVVLSYRYWHGHFGDDPSILGKQFFMDTAPITVVGVASPGFDLMGAGDTDVYQPLSTENVPPSELTNRWLLGVGRLKPGVNLEQAQSAMNVLARHFEEAFPDTNKDLGVKLQPLHDALFGWTRPILYPLLGAVAFVLLIACTNIANLMLSKAAARRKEVGIRSALGANRLRLVRQVLTESVLVAVLGGLLGLGLSFGGTRAFVALAPQWYPQAKEITIDVRVLAFTLVISVLAGIAFGLAPALRNSKVDLIDSLKEAGRSSSTGSRHRTRSIFVVVEVALSLVLFISAGLMMNTFLRVLRSSPGFQAEHVLTAEFRLTGKKYLDVAPLEKTGFDIVTPQVEIFCKQVLERVKALPGVQSAALIDWLPMSDQMDSSGRTFTIAGRTPMLAGEKPGAIYTAISPDYFKVMQIPLLRGRYPGEQDVESTPWVVVINQVMARKFWRNQDPVGQVITFDTVPNEERPREIVGIVGDVKQVASGMDPQPEIYVPYLQQVSQTPSMFTETRLHKNLVLRTSFESQSLIDSLRKTIAELDKSTPVYGITSVRQVVVDSTTWERFYTQLLGGFAFVAILLAAIGIYGVISFSVLERRHEIGIRMALGAQRQQVIGLMLKEGMVLSLFGVVIGVAASFAATPLIKSFLYGVKPYDPLTWSLVSLFLVGVTIVATYVPGRRATKVDPMVTLRQE